MTSTRSIESRVHEYITQNFHVPDPSRLASDTSLLNTGIIDSTGYLEVFEWIREEFGVRVADDEMDPANFETIANITDYLGRKLG